MSTRRSILALSTLLVLSFASTAFAQSGATTSTTDPTFEVSAGYQYLHLPDQSFPFGLAVDATRHYGNIGLVGEVGWSRHSDDTAGVDFSTNMFHFAAGPRWARHGAGRLWPYAQVLGGVALARSSSDFAGVDDSDTDAAFMLQPGVGVTMVGGDGWGVFGQVDYRRTFFDEPDNTEDSVNNQFRVYVGVRMLLD